MIEIHRVGDNKIIITGHSQPDICASVSCIMFTSIKLLKEYDENCIKYTDENDEVLIEILKRDNIIDMIVKNMFQCFLELHQDAPPGTMVFYVTPEIG